MTELLSTSALHDNFCKLSITHGTGSSPDCLVVLLNSIINILSFKVTCRTVENNMFFKL